MRVREQARAYNPVTTKGKRGSRNNYPLHHTFSNTGCHGLKVYPTISSHSCSCASLFVFRKQTLGRLLGKVKWWMWVLMIELEFSNKKDQCSKLKFSLSLCVCWSGPNSITYFAKWDIAKYTQNEVKQCLFLWNCISGWRESFYHISRMEQPPGGRRENIAKVQAISAKGPRIHEWS